MKARPRSRRPAVGDLDFDAILSIQLTVGVLSHNVPNGTCLVFVMRSNAIPTARTSAANSRSEFVRRPCGVSSETTSAAMSAGKASRHTAGGVSSTRENQTPPAPSAAASWYPAYVGMSGTSSRTWVGLELRRCRSEIRSRSARRTSEWIPRPMVFGLPRMASFSGVKKPFAAGRMIAA